MTTSTPTSTGSILDSAADRGDQVLRRFKGRYSPNEPWDTVLTDVLCSVQHALARRGEPVRKFLELAVRAEDKYEKDRPGQFERPSDLDSAEFDASQRVRSQTRVNTTAQLANWSATAGDDSLNDYARRWGHDLSLDEVVTNVLYDLAAAVNRLADNEVHFASCFGSSMDHVAEEYVPRYEEPSSLLQSSGRDLA